MFDALNRLAQRARNAAELRRVLGELRTSDRDLIEHIRSARLTYLTDLRLASIAATCREIEAAELPGVFIEAGCALGGSSILIGSAKSAERPFRVYDVFGMIPPPGEEDTDDVHARYRTIAEGGSPGIGGDAYYGYRDDLYDVVAENLQNFGVDLEARHVSLVKGLVQDTLHVDEPVAFVHIDVDWYDPVLTCLERIGPRLVVGGSIILDDYDDWGGCRKATDEYLSRVPDQFSLDRRATSLKLTRIGGGPS